MCAGAKAPVTRKSWRAESTRQLCEHLSPCVRSRGKDADTAPLMELGPATSEAGLAPSCESGKRSSFHWTSPSCQFDKLQIICFHYRQAALIFKLFASSKHYSLTTTTKSNCTFHDSPCRRDPSHP